MTVKRILIIFLVLLGVAALIAIPAQAATINVADGEVDVADNGVCALIEAVENANDTTNGQPHDDCAAGNPSGADTIDLPSNGYFFFSNSGLPNIAGEITVSGDGSTLKRDDNAAAFRFFTIDSSGNLTLNDLKLMSGYEWGAGERGGAILNAGGILTVNRCTFEDNLAEFGGAIYNHGTATIVDSTLIRNNVVPNIAGASGGAVYNEVSMTIEGSLIVDNYAENSGGGLFNVGVITVTNSTLHNNTGLFGWGGALDNYLTATLTNVTATDNRGEGGAIYNENGATLTLSRSLISNNSNGFTPQEVTNEAGGTVIANDYNLFGQSGSADVFGFTPGASDIVPSEARADILAASPANNGGPTHTLALKADSPAIDAAPSADCVPSPTDNVDQRGEPRGVDGDGGASTDECDVGAYEAQGIPTDPMLFVSPAAAGTVSGLGNVTPQDIVAQNLDDDSWAMHFDGSDVGVTKIIAAFAILPDDSILLAFKANQPITNVGTFTPWDVARFIPSSLGNVTNGTFEWYIDGSDVGLTTTAEKIDALDVLSDDRVLVSTTGTMAVPKPGGGTLKSQNDDLTALAPSSLGTMTAGTWALYFNGAIVTGLGAENVGGAHVDEATGDLYLTITGAFTIGGVKGNGKDVMLLAPSGGGYTVSHFWRGGQNGFNLNLGGIEMK